MNFAGKMALLTFRHAEQFNPFVLSSIFLYYIVGRIGRAIAHDYPLERAHRLRHHRMDRRFDRSGFVAGRGHDDIGRKLQHDGTSLASSLARVGTSDLEDGKADSARSVESARSIQACVHLM